MMDRSALLNACKVEFLRGFASALEIALSSEPVRILLLSTQMQASGRQVDLSRSQPAMDAENVLKQEAFSDMQKLLARSFQTAYDTFRPSFSLASGVHSLSLIDHSSIEENLCIDEMTTRLSHAAEDELRDLNARIARLFDQKEIKERENPFRPYLVSRCVVTAVALLGLEESASRKLTGGIIDRLIDSVSTIYSPINALLEIHGVDSRIDLQIKQLYSPGLEKFALLSSYRSAAAQMANRPELENSAGMEHLLELMHRTGGLLPSAAGAPVPREAGRRQTEAGPRIGAALRQSVLDASLGAADALTNEMLQTHVSETSATASTSLGASALAPEHAKGAAHDIAGKVHASEQGVVDVVAILFDYILRDKMLPIEVRVQLGRLQQLLLNVTLIDPALLSSANHSARVLLDRIASVACALPPADPWSEKLLPEIHRIVDALLLEDGRDEPAFARQLHAFEVFVARELPLANESMARTVSAVAKAEERSACFLRLSAKMASILQQIGADSHLQSFLVGPWSRAVEHVARDDLKKAEAMCSLVPDLVWSTYPKVTRESRQQLLGMIPVLVNGLREGLSQLGQADVLHEDILSWMMGAHRKALRPHEHQVHEPTLAQICSEFSVLPLEIRTPLVAGNVKLDARYLEEALCEQKAALLELDPLLDPVALYITSRHLNSAGQAVALRLQTGITIELALEGGSSLARIIWISPGREQLILKVDGKVLPALVSTSVLCSEFVAGRARFVERTRLCERAIQSLLVSTGR